MHRVVAVSAGMTFPKKGNHRFYHAHRYLNYGLLGLASSLPVDVFVYQASPDQIINMGKSKNPIEYLSKASATLESCSKNNINPDIA
jgi:hypothetical protein